MKSTLWIVPILLLSATANVHATPPLSSRYIVGFDVLPADHESFHGDKVVDVNEAINFFVVESLQPPVVYYASLSGDASVKYVEQDLVAYHTDYVPNDSFYGQYQYDMKSGTTKMETAWGKTLGSTATKVCVVDTGQYRAHQDFSGTSWYAWKDFVNGRTAAYDDNGHGTHVTGTIAARINNAKGVAGIAQVSVAGAKVLSGSGSGSISAVANGITWCADGGAHIISASIGGPAATTLQNAVNYADGKGITQVYAAGNDGPCTNCVNYPAKYAASIAVSCTTSSNALCSYSSQGAEIDFAAPGDNIASTWPNRSPCSTSDTNCYILSSGTSMSTPHVAGMAALIKSYHPSYTKAQIYSALQSSARDLGTSGRDVKFGYGLIEGDWT